MYVRNVRCHACDTWTNERRKVEQYSVWAESAIYCKWVAAVSAFDENQDIVPSMRLFNFLLAGWFTRVILLCKILEVFGTIWSLITAEPHAITWKDGLQHLSCCNRWTFLVEIEESDQDFKMFDLADLWFIRVHSYIYMPIWTDHFLKRGLPLLAPLSIEEERNEIVAHN